MHDSEQMLDSLDDVAADVEAADRALRFNEASRRFVNATDVWFRGSRAIRNRTRWPSVCLATNLKEAEQMAFWVLASDPEQAGSGDRYQVVVASLEGDRIDEQCEFAVGIDEDGEVFGSYRDSERVELLELLADGGRVRMLTPTSNPPRDEVFEQFAASVSRD